MGSFQPSVCCGVPRGSMLGPLLFLLHLGELAASLGLSHFYADDSHLSLHMGPPSTVAHQWRRMDLGVQRITEWMGSNRLMRLNPEKTDFLWCATCRRSIHLDIGELSVCGDLES